MIIRKVTSSDRSEFVSMGREFYTSEAVLHDIPQSYHERAFDELMRSEVYLACVFFEVNGSTAGYALLNKSYSREVGGTVIWVEELYLRPQYRCRGFSSEFFEWLEKTYPAARYRLEIEPDNTRAQALYERKGFTCLGYKQLVRDMSD